MIQLYRKQLKDIESFRSFVNKYFEEGIISDEDKVKIRKKINRLIPIIKQLAEDASVYLDASQYQHDSILIELNLIDNIFQKVRGSTAPTLDLIDRIYGYYDNLRRINLRKVKNPFFYIGEIIRIPFYIVEFAGFNKNKIEFSLLGKTWKVFIGLTLYLAALATILMYLGINIHELIAKLKLLL